MRARQFWPGKPVLIAGGMRLLELYRKLRYKMLAPRGLDWTEEIMHHPQPPQPPPLQEWLLLARLAASNLAWMASLSKPLS